MAHCTTSTYWHGTTEPAEPHSYQGCTIYDMHPTLSIQTKEGPSGPHAALPLLAVTRRKDQNYNKSLGCNQIYPTHLK